MPRLASKDALVDRAIELFRAKGYSATSIGDIVAACGITKGSLYYHFESKEELALAAMDKVHAYFTDRIFSLVLAAEEPGATELKAFNRAIEEFFLSHPDGCLLANLSLELGTGFDIFRDRIQRFFADWQACYAKVFARNHGREQAAGLAADAVAAVHGCIMMQRIGAGIEPLRRQHAKLLELTGNRKRA
jgi:AcrR family transcriptional regulator